jgi:hypothetical protein
LDLREGLSFILSHLELPIWPRIIYAGAATEKVLNERIALNIFERYRVDCKINAYRSLRRQPPSLLSLHLNKKYLETVLKRIKKLLKGYPTVIDASQDTVDIYQPIEVPLLETIPILDWMCEMEPSNAFLKFAEGWLSGGRADKNHNLSFWYCMLWIPGSLSSASGEEVKLIQKWNGVRPSIDENVFEDFRYYLIDLKVNMSRKGIRPPTSSCDFCDAEISYILDKAGYIRHRLCSKCVTSNDFSTYQVNLVDKTIPTYKGQN